MVILYSNNCPKCQVLKSKLKSKNIEFKENNSVEEMIKLGIVQVPYLMIEDKLLNFKEANEWINNK